MENKQQLILNRTFDAPIETIWRLWTTPEGFAAWYGFPGTVPLDSVQMDVRVGGELRCTTVLSDTEKYPFYGHYLAIEEPTKLEFSFEMEGNPNKEIMTVELTSVDDKTEMRFTQSGHLPSEEYNVGLREGWTGFFDQLDEKISEEK